MTCEDLKNEYKLTNDGDSWGNSMSWWFAIADELEGNRGLLCPEHWEYRMSPMRPDNENYEASIVTDYPDDDLIEFGNVLERYTRLLKHLGEDY